MTYYVLLLWRWMRPRNRKRNTPVRYLRHYLEAVNRPRVVTQDSARK